VRTLKLNLLLVALAIPLFAGTPAELQAQRRQTIRLTTLVPRGSSYHRALQRMGQAWREASDGRIRLVIYAGGIQGGEAAMVERMAINQSQAAMLTADGLKAIEPAVAGVQLMPMMFRTLEEADYVIEQMEPTLEGRLLERGYVVLGWANTGWVRVFSNAPVRTVDDLRAMRIFTTTGSPETDAVLNAAGLNPIPLDPNDILTGLQTGLIDAAALPPFFALAARIYDPAPYMLELNWVPLVGAIVIKRETWEAVPAELRPALMAASREATTEIHRSGRSESDDAVETMRDSWNLQIQSVEAGGAIEADWLQASESSYPSIRGRVVPTDIFDEVQRLVLEFRERGGDSP
jgi:TRAP-type C4-dicarboxylate transport system substrate-binding protein